jgi:hypothetical protein
VKEERPMRIRAKLKAVFVCILVLILTLTAVGTVMAQDGDDGDEGETPKAFEHPVVAVFREYFGDEVAEEVIAYHSGGEGDEEGGVGFGVLVKMYAIAAESEEACATAEGPCTPVTVEELMAAYKSGTGMGELFKLYGKPAVLGVGHMKDKDKGGPPEHAGPKDKERDGDGPPEHAGPKDKDKDKSKD